MMKGFMPGPMTLLFFVLTGVLLVRSDTMPTVQVSGVRASAAFHVVRSHAPPVGGVATPATHRIPTGGTTAAATATPPTDPFAPVYIVTSQATHQGIRGLAREVVVRHDSAGMPLVIAESRTDRLGEISDYVHVNERRCGGYFAFPTRAEAETFVQADRAKQAMAKTMLAGYTLDNQTTISRWLPQVQERNLYDTINHLSSYQNRYFASSHGKTSAEWIRTHWQSLAAGRDDVTTELFTACGNCSTQPSVILTIPGWDLPNEVVVLGAHLDSINGNTPNDPNQHAPGADDDASGIATLTETLRIALADGWQPRRTVKFMGYAAEEVGLRGSNAIAQSFRASGINVVSVLQVDMTNYKAGATSDMKLISDYSNTELKNFFVILFDTYLAPMGLTRSNSACGYACSDHASWTNAGYPAAMMFEGGSPNGSFPYIHTTYDTLATMGESAQHSVKFTQFALAYLGETAKTRGKVTGGPAQVLMRE
ncbi:leucyl aminopeptidase [Pseudoxanthomonas japonensis]|uniref:M20/M25/M40 family metallo-hydrolase n=1 Tax=Pseudoxanthomonas japonensis TaxID=69284 RepID=UPI002865B12F|nr:M20/M25/M40 family metallo-hydrolase [Pseudoxanthomonas japonensis]MDR7069790.1 leucyl aminopeptidase [Pseudoxanthomonas japonensis]